MSSLHVAMQRGPYLHPVSWMSGVWPLRILISSCLDFLWFIVSAILAISINPFRVRCRLASTTSMHLANFSKSCLLRRSQLMPPKERNDHVSEIASSPDLVLE